MPLPADRLPPDLRTLPARVAALERALTELRAAQRLPHASMRSGAVTIRDDAGNVYAEMTASGGAENLPGFVAYAADPNDLSYAMLTSAGMEWGLFEEPYAVQPFIEHSTASGLDPTVLSAGSGYRGSTGAYRQAMWRLVSPTSGTDQPYMEVYSDAPGTTADLRVGGAMSAGNLAFGTTTVTITAANTPASATVSGLNIAGTTFRGYASAATSVPGTNGSNGVTGVAVTSPTSTGLTVWANRQSVQAVTVNWLVIGQ